MDLTRLYRHLLKHIDDGPTLVVVINGLIPNFIFVHYPFKQLHFLIRAEQVVQLLRTLHGRVVVIRSPQFLLHNVVGVLHLDFQLAEHVDALGGCEWPWLFRRWLRLVHYIIIFSKFYFIA